MKRRRIGMVLCLATLTLGGCTLPTSSLSPAFPPMETGDWPENSNERYADLARYYNGDAQWGMERVIHDIDSCYASQGGAFVNQRALRDCLVLDGVGVIDNARRQRFYGVTLAYFSLDARSRRWARYAPRAGLTDPIQAYHYIKYSSAMAHKFQ